MRVGNLVKRQKKLYVFTFDVKDTHYGKKI